MYQENEIYHTILWYLTHHTISVKYNISGYFSYNRSCYLCNWRKEIPINTRESCIWTAYLWGVSWFSIRRLTKILPNYSVVCWMLANDMIGTMMLLLELFFLLFCTYCKSFIQLFFHEIHTCFNIEWDIERESIMIHSLYTFTYLDRIIPVTIYCHTSIILYSFF